MKPETIIISRTVINPFGVKVFRCCGSCQYKQINQKGNRFCPKRRKKVGQKNFCKEWQMSRMLRKLQPPQ